MQSSSIQEHQKQRRGFSCSHPHHLSRLISLYTPITFHASSLSNLNSFPLLFQRWHWLAIVPDLLRMTGKKTRKPHFFKVLLGDFAQQLRIPPDFVKHLSGEASQRVILHGPNGRSWHVGLDRTPKGTFLLSGWPNFVKDHLLKGHEFLTFRYDGDMHFSVLIFDTSGCEKEDVASARTCKEHQHFAGKGVGCGSANCSLDACCCPQQNDSRSTRLSSPESYKVEVKTEDNNIPVGMPSSENKRTEGYRPKRGLVTEEERLKAKDAAYSFRSKFPCFVSCMTASTVRKSLTLRIPSNFSRAYFPRSRTNLVLRDPRGKAWAVAYLPSPPGYISAGWSAFVRGNNLKVGDYCACELVSSAELRVNIFKTVQASHTGIQGLNQDQEDSVLG